MSVTRVGDINLFDGFPGKRLVSWCKQQKLSYIPNIVFLDLIQPFYYRRTTRKISKKQ